MNIFDEVTRELYYYYNDTAGIPLSQLKFEAVERGSSLM